MRCLRREIRRSHRRTRTAATSPSSPTSITARRRSSMRCCIRAARSAPTSESPSARWTATSSSASAASPSLPRTPPSTTTTPHQHRRYAGPRRFRRRSGAHAVDGRRRGPAGRRVRRPASADALRAGQGVRARPSADCRHQQDRSARCPSGRGAERDLRSLHRSRRVGSAARLSR